MPDDPTTVPTVDAEGLQNISESGKNPATRVKDYEAAVGIVKQVVLEDEPDRLDRVNEQALLDKQGPFIQEELDLANQSWRQNNDWGGASAKSEQAQAPYAELFNGFTVEFDDTVQGAQIEEYGARIAESWSVLHSRIWREHSFQDLNLTRIAVNFGVAIADHEHPRDWRWRAGALGEHYFPRPMQAYENATSIHVRIREYREDQLNRWLKNPNAEAVGFNLDAIKDAMLACNTSAGGSQQNYWETLTNNVYGQTYGRRASVRLFTLRTVELTDDGSEMVSERMGRADGRGEDFIYRSKKPDWVETMADSFTIFSSGIGNGDLHSIKGLANKVFSTSQTENQFINQMYDFARIYMSPMFESDDANAAQKLGSMEIALFNLIPKGLKLVPATAAPNYAQSILPLIEFSSQLGQRNTGVFQPQATPASVEQTREEVMTRTMQNAVMTSAAIVLHENSKERQYNLSLRRMQRRDYSPADPGYKELKMFFADLEQRGVPKEVFYHVTYIKPNRQVGGGSAAVGQMLLEKAAGLRAFLDPVAQKTLDEMVITRLLGSSYAKILIPTLGIQRTSDQQRFAMDENAFFLLNIAKPVLPDDDHFQHAQIHDAALPDVELQFSQGQLPPAQMLDFLNRFIPHQRAHLAALVNNKKQTQAIGQFNADLNKAVMTQEHLTNAAQKQQNILAQQAQAQAQKEAQAQQQGGGGEGGPSGIEESQQKLQQRAAEAQLALNTTAAKSAATLRANQAEHEQDLQHKAEDHQQDAAFRDATNASDLLHAAAPPPRPVIPPPADLPGSQP